MTKNIDTVDESESLLAKTYRLTSVEDVTKVVTVDHKSKCEVKQKEPRPRHADHIQ